MMQDDGTQVSLGFSEDGANKDKFVLRGPDGKEMILAGTGASGGTGGGTCGLLCSVLTVKVIDGVAQVIPMVPDVYVGASVNRLKAVFTDTINVKTIAFPMATSELATASVGKSLGVIGTDGVNAIVGLVNSPDGRTDSLVTDMAQAKQDIAFLKAELLAVKKELAMKENKQNACRSELIPVTVIKTVGSGDWIVSPPVLKILPMQEKDRIEV